MQIGIFTARIVRKGDRYGRNDCLTYDKDEPMVEFHTGNQLVSNYYVSTFMACKGGIQLEGGVPEWHLTNEQTEKVKDWIKRSAS